MVQGFPHGKDAIKLAQGVPIVIIDRDEQLDPESMDRNLGRATLSLARQLVFLGRTVYLAAQLPQSFTSKTPNGVKFSDGVHYFDLGPSYDTTRLFDEFQTELQSNFHLLTVGRAQAIMESRDDSRCLTRFLITGGASSGDFGVQPQIVAQLTDKIVCHSAEERQALLDAGCPTDSIAVFANFNETTAVTNMLSLIDQVAATKQDDNDISQNSNTPEAQHGRVGVLTTYNQRCGLATYADYFLRHFSDEEVVVLAEDVPRDQIIDTDAVNVRRCWTRQASDFSALAQVVYEEGISILHLNCHYRFFNGALFSTFLNSLRENGVLVIAHIHNPFTVDQDLSSLITASDRLIVHTEENKLEVIANGANPAKVCVLEHGVEFHRTHNRETARATLEIPDGQKAVVCFGFVQPHKGIDQVIDAVNQLKSSDPNTALYIVGGPHLEDPASCDYHRSLKTLAENLGIAERVHFIDGFVSDETVRDYLFAADAVVMNYQSQYYEASGAIALALGCGAPIVASTAPPFARLGSTVFHVTTGYPLPLALHLVLNNQTLNETLRNNARSWAEQYSWENTAQILQQIYTDVSTEQAQAKLSTVENNTSAAINSANQEQASTHNGRSLRVLMQNRGNAYTQRGGDTVVMDRVAEELRSLGVTVDVDLTGEADLLSYDLIHLHNFATPEITEGYARRAVEANVPYVVTTMYEDLPRFYNQMFAWYDLLKQYISGGQSKETWAQLLPNMANCQPSSRWENSWTASHAAALICTGDAERASLRNDYPDAKQIEIYYPGCDLDVESANPDLIREQLGIDDFVLCVGRLETRKNQLGLLRALEDSEIPVVFATGGFTYQPEYEALCKAFVRKGRTVFLERLEPEMLASAFAAAKVHALPSWYELPGIVSEEAARFGSNIVVTEYGTTRDYFGDYAYYCSPDDVESIYNATMAAFYSPARPELKQMVDQFTWENAGQKVLSVYHDVLGETIETQRSTYELPEWRYHDDSVRVHDSIQSASQRAKQASQTLKQIARVTPPNENADGELHGRSAKEWCDEGDRVANQGRYDDALRLYEKAVEVDEEFARAHRSRGVILLQQQELVEAESHLRHAIALDDQNVKSIAGLGSCLWQKGQHDEAFNYFKQALEQDPYELSALLHLLNAAYALNRFGVLERALTRYLERDSSNRDMLFCLAGCYYKQRKFDEAERVVESILEQEADYADAKRLQEIIQRDRKLEVVNSTASPAVEQHYTNSIDRDIQEMQQAKSEKDYDVVLSKADKLLKCNGLTENQKALIFVSKGDALACSGELLRADEYFTRAQYNNSYRSRALTGRGVVASTLGKWGEAEKYFGEAVELASDSDAAITGLGMCSMQKGQHEAAWDKFRQALDVNSENLSAIYGIIQLGYTLKRLPEVEQFVRGYLEIHPADLSMLYSFAGCLYAQGKQTEAIEPLEKIQVFEPHHELAGELLDKIRAELECGDPEQSRQG